MTPSTPGALSRLTRVITGEPDDRKRSRPVRWEAVGKGPKPRAPRQRPTQPQAGPGGTAAAVDSCRPRPGRANGGEDRARAGLRGRFPAMQLRVPPEAGGARRPAGLAG